MRSDNFAFLTIFGTRSVESRNRRIAAYYGYYGLQFKTLVSISTSGLGEVRNCKISIAPPAINYSRIPYEKDIGL